MTDQSCPNDQLFGAQLLDHGLRNSDDIDIFKWSDRYDPTIFNGLHSLKSIVVLPFKNISSDPENEYFADGVTEEIINALSKVEGLKVTSRTSSFAYKNKPKDIRIIGRELGVSTALEGSIRRSGNRIRISTQLIRTDNGFHVWSDSFDRDLTDIFRLQDEISLLIADKIRENFGHLEIGDHLVTTQTGNLDAYFSYLKGRFFQLRWHADDFEKAVREYEKSIAQDPDYFQPYYGLVQCYGLMAAWRFMDKDLALEKANYYLIEGLKINDKTCEAHFALATKSLWIDWKPHQALRHLKRALAINPNDSESLEAAAEAHIPLGQFDEASKYIQQAIEVNPLSANHHFTLGNIHYLQRKFPEALASFERTLQIDPTWNFSLQVSACCHVLMGNKKALESLLTDHPDLTEGALFRNLYEAINDGKKINPGEIPEPNDVHLSWKLWVLIYADRKKDAFQHLLDRIENKQGQYLNFHVEPLNEPLRSLPEYRVLIENVFDKPVSEDVQRENVPTKILIPQEEQELYKTKLEKLMEKEHLYISENLTLRSLAEAVGLNANKLSWLLNEVIGKNFNEYVNGLRVQEFKKKAMEPAYGQYSLLGIAFECGFNSKTVFNDFFKRAENMTPSAWIKSQKARTGSGPDV